MDKMCTSANHNVNSYNKSYTPVEYYYTNTFFTLGYFFIADTSQQLQLLESATESKI